MDKQKPKIKKYNRNCAIARRNAQIKTIEKEMKDIESLLFKDAKEIQGLQSKIKEIKKNMDAMKSEYGNLYSELCKLNKK